jgi:hypothetical protein
MQSRFSKVSKNKPSSAAFKTHQVFDVATSLTESKYIANDYADANRYAYKASVVVVGNSTVKPYEPVYLDGLPNGMSGYWTVLSVTHVFGGQPAKYMMRLEVGTDVLGQTDENAYKAKDTRDVAGELSNQNLSPVPTVLQDYSFSVNNSPLEENNGVVNPSNTTSPKKTAVPENIVPEDIYSVTPPDFSIIKRPVSWGAGKPKGTA